MIGLEDRQALARDIHTAHTTGARLKCACETAGIDLRTLQRWKAFDGLVGGDGRPHAVRATPSHALSEAERAQLLAVANAPRFAAVPPARIVPMLADEGVYLASLDNADLENNGAASSRRGKKGIKPDNWARLICQSARFFFQQIACAITNHSDEKPEYMRLMRLFHSAYYLKNW